MKRKGGLPLTLVLTALIAAPLLVAPSVIRGLAADAWVSHHLAMKALPRPRKAAARSLVERTEAAIWNLAPLPQASSAAIRTLQIGQRVQYQERDLEAALVIYQGVRAACARVRSRVVSGAGFAVIEARAAALESAARKGAAK